jgi:hypothetical protein
MLVSIFLGALKIDKFIIFLLLSYDMGFFSWLADIIFGRTRIREEKKELGLIRDISELTKEEISVEKQEKRVANELINLLKEHYYTISARGKIRGGDLENLYNDILSRLNKLKSEKLNVRDEEYLTDIVSKLLNNYFELSNSTVYAFARDPKYGTMFSNRDFDTLNLLNNELKQLIGQLKSELAVEESIGERKKKDIRDIYSEEEREEGR